MQNIKDALLREVEAGRNLFNLHQAMDACGFADNPFWDNYAIVADGIYDLIGEHTETFEESVTHLALTAPFLTNERRTEMLYAEYKKNFPDQPSPVSYVGDIQNTDRPAGSYPPDRRGN